MSEHEHHEPEPYWQTDLAIGEGHFYRDTYTLRLKLHQSSERISWREELFPLSAAQKRDRRRSYFHGKPYILLPDYTVTVATYPEPRPSGAIGEVVGSDWEGMQHEDVGNAQAWYYPIDRTLILWECFLEERFRQADPREDGTLKGVWTGFERTTLERCRGAQRIYTTWEDIYARDAWAQFLEQQGYRPVAPAAFIKEVASG